MTAPGSNKTWLAQLPMFRDWATVAPHLPYRASIPIERVWDVGLPSPHLVDAWRSARGRRQMMAFELAEVRDFVVDGHAHQGAVAEADYADRPAPRDSRPENRTEALRTELEALDDDDLFARGHRMANDHDVASDELSQVFGRAAQERVDSGDVPGALSIVRASPANSVFRHVFFEKLTEAGLWDRKKMPLAKVPEARMDSAMASAALLFERSYRDQETAESVIGDRTRPVVAEMVKIDPTEAEAYVRPLPRGVYKAHLMDMIWVASNESRRSPPSP